MSMQLLPDVKVSSPAKINLFLHITGKRSDGYHELNSLMTCVGLYDTISFSFDQPDIRVGCTDPDIPNDQTNLAWMAVDVFYEKFIAQNHGVRSGVHIDIEKKIPSGAGLGGGSSNAATVLRELNIYHGNPFSHKDLRALGLFLGADVPFFIDGTPAIATGVGEKLHEYKGLPSFYIILVYPGFKVSTAKVYKKFKFGLTKPQNTISNTRLKKYCFNACEHLINDLEDVTASMHPEISLIKQNLIRLGAMGALMSGSGSSVFGLYTDKTEALSAYERMVHAGQSCGWQIHLVDMIK